MEPWASIVTGLPLCRSIQAEISLFRQINFQHCLGWLENFNGSVVSGAWLGYGSGDDLIASLAWRPAFAARKAPEYRAPLWSWASLDGRIETSSLAHRGVMLPGNKVLEIECQCPGQDAFGAVSGGYMLARGYFLDASLHPSIRGVVHKDGFEAMYRDDCHDYAEDITSELDVLCWYLGYDRSNHNMIIL